MLGAVVVRRGARTAIEEAAVFGIVEDDLDGVMAWAEQSFGSLFGAWNVFFAQEDARAAARSFLRNAASLELWGVGLHRSLVSAYCAESVPNDPTVSPGGIHIATCVRPAPIAQNGTVAGHEILVPTSVAASTAQRL
jgi:hypothetical protein